KWSRARCDLPPLASGAGLAAEALVAVVGDLLDEVWVGEHGGSFRVAPRGPGGWNGWDGEVRAAGSPASRRDGGRDGTQRHGTRRDGTRRDGAPDRVGERCASGAAASGSAGERGAAAG